jgi:hypothetical protein
MGVGYTNQEATKDLRIEIMRQERKIHYFRDMFTSMCEPLQEPSCHKYLGTSMFILARKKQTVETALAKNVPHV